MIQKVLIRNSDENPFEQSFVEIELKEKEKILSNEPYVAELYAMYSGNMPSKKETFEIDNNAIHKCKIIDITNNIANVEINRKYSTTINLDREKKEYASFIQPDAMIDLKVTNLSKKNEYSASLSNAVSEIKRNEIINAIGKNTIAYVAKVDELVHGGYYLTIDGIKVFMPGSLAGMNKVINFETLITKSIYVMPINYSNDFKMIVVSHRDYLKTLKPIELDKLKFDVKYTGKITGVSKYGIFAEFNTDSDFEKPLLLTGLMPTSEMDHLILTQFTARSYKAGDEIEFYVKSVVDDKKIILSTYYIDWNKIFKDYKTEMEVECTIIKIHDNIIFVQIKNTQIVGSISNYDQTYNIGDVIKLLISKVDNINKKLFLKQLTSN